MGPVLEGSQGDVADEGNFRKKAPSDFSYVLVVSFVKSPNECGILSSQ